MTEAGLKYLEIVKQLVKNNRGQIESERSYLNWQRDRLEVSSHEAEAIEQRVLSAYQKFLNQASSPDTPANAPPLRQSSSADPSLPASNSADPNFSDPNYAVKLERYRNLFAQALDANQLSDAATQDRLWQLQRELRLDGQDVAQVEQQVLSDRSKTAPPDSNGGVSSQGASSQGASSALPPTEIQSSRPPSSLSISSRSPEVYPEDYNELQQHLTNQDWKAADRATFDLMLKLTGRTEEGWLDIQAIEALTCNDLNRIDRLWHQHSGGQFGFRTQRQYYSTATISEPTFINSAQTTYTRALELSKKVGWWQRGAHFHKYYNQLIFALDAPAGHLPALWYWRIPWWRTLQFGGLGTGRGGCRVDADLIAALMKRLQECDSPARSRST